MKKYLILLVAFLALAPISCDLEEDEVPCEPSCGEVVRKGFGSDVADFYEMIVRNECTGRTKAFQVTKEEWNTWETGEYVCTTDGTSWKRSPTKSK